VSRNSDWEAGLPSESRTVQTTQNINEIITPAETMSGTIVIKVTGQSATASNDVLLRGFIIEILN
jgi:hypothetical protein